MTVPCTRIPVASKMRKLIPTILLLLCASFCEAQSYVPFPTDSATWFDFVHVYGNEQPPSSILMVHRIEGDSVINGANYLNVYEASSSATEYIGGLREDDDRNIWWLPSSSGTDALDLQTIVIPDPPEEVLLYSFNELAIGAPVPVNSGNSNFVVTSIDSIQVDGVYRKTYRLSCQHLLGNEDVWVEGIGSVHGLFSPLQYEFEWTLSMECFTGGNSTWDNPLTSFAGCEIPMWMEQPTPRSTSLFPAPCSDHLNLRGFGAGRCTILNAIGEVCAQHPLRADGAIPVSALEPEAYVLLFEGGGGQQRRCERFIVQR